MLTNDELQAIRARYNYMVEACPSDRGMLERDRYCRDYAQKDIPALLSHIEAQRNALAKAEAAKAVLVEALEKTTSTLDIINERMPGGTYYKEYEPLATDALMKARAALARLARAKGEACPKN